MGKYWTELLPEVGRSIVRMGNEQLRTLEKINGYKEQIRELRKEQLEREQEILGIVSQDWTKTEIFEARNKSDKQA